MRYISYVNADTTDNCDRRRKTPSLFAIGLLMFLNYTNYVGNDRLMNAYVCLDNYLIS